MPEDLTVLIVGNGAREHALSAAYENSTQVKKIVVVPGNDLISYRRKKEVIIDHSCNLTDPQSILQVTIKHQPDLVDVAQDDALASGTVDLLQQNGFQAFGPTKNAARIEWDKKWSREFMRRQQIPCPDFQYFHSEKEGIEYVQALYQKESQKLLYVKAAGLCSGKGALKSTNLEEARQNILLMKTFPNKAGETFLVEEGLIGEEFSCYALSDGQNYHLFKSAQDHKTVFNFDQGSQTGGMGAISPAMVTENFKTEIEDQMIKKAIRGMAQEGIPFRGILYVGGIVDERVINIEYNARWGDPECQVVLPSLKTDYLSMIMACLEGKISETKIEQDRKTRFCLVGASKGYPEGYSTAKGKRLYGIEEALNIEGITIFGSGIKIEEGKFYANGGRLCSIVAEGENILQAKQRAYSAISRLHLEGNNLQYRIDIGWRDVERHLKKLC